MRLKTSKIMKEWGDAYARGVQAYEECEMAKFEIDQINQIIHEQQCSFISRKWEGEIPTCKVENCKHCGNRKEPLFLYKPGTHI